MMWFDKWFMKMSRRAWENRHNSDDETLVTATGPVSTRRGTSAVQGKRMDFSIFKAEGGYIIQHYVDDTNNNHAKYAVHEKEPKLLIVNSGEDLGKAIDQLIVLEALKA